MLLWLPLLRDRKGVIDIVTGRTKGGVHKIPLARLMASLVVMGIAPLLTIITTHDVF